MLVNEDDLASRELPCGSFLQKPVLGTGQITTTNCISWILKWGRKEKVKLSPKGKKDLILTFGVYITFMRLVIKYYFTPFLELKKYVYIYM